MLIDNDVESPLSKEITRFNETHFNVEGNFYDDRENKSNTFFFLLLLLPEKKTWLFQLLEKKKKYKLYLVKVSL